MTIKDDLTEMLVGREGAIKVPGKIFLTPTNTRIYNNPTTCIAGLVVHEGLLVSEESQDLREMWECELIIIPHRKFSGVKEDGSKTFFADHSVDGILTSNFGDPNRWGKKYFDSGVVK